MSTKYALSAVLVVAACKKDTPAPTPPEPPPVQQAAMPAESEPMPEAEAMPDLVQTAIDSGTMSAFVRLLDATELTFSLQEPGPFTVFIPSDDSMAALGPKAIEHMLAEGHLEGLKHVLNGHIVAGRLTLADLADRKGLEALNAEALSVRPHDGEVEINGKKIVQGDLEASNGLIHVVDGMLFQPKPTSKKKKKKSHKKH